MNNFFKSVHNIQSAALLYKDMVKTLSKTNPTVLSKISNEFADLISPSFQQLIFKLSKIDNLEFNCHGLIVTVTKFSFNYRFQLGRIRVQGFRTNFNDETEKWSYVPYSKYDLSRQVVASFLSKIPNITYEEIGAYLWVSGKTFPVKHLIKEATKGTFFKVGGFKGATKQWYLQPKW